MAMLNESIAQDYKISDAAEATVEKPIRNSPRTITRRGLLSLGQTVPLTGAGALALQGCRDGGGSLSKSNMLSSQSISEPPSLTPEPMNSVINNKLSLAQASRFLSQAAIGYSKADILSVTDLGYAAWINGQFAKPRTQKFWDYLLAKGVDKEPRAIGYDSLIWSQLMGNDELLRQRVGLALHDMWVVSIYGIPGSWKGFVMADYFDRLWDNAFGNYRDIMEAVTTSVGMGLYLTFLGSEKANARGASPDENFARELMQLFTIGLHMLNQDGTIVLKDGKPVSTYTQSDVIQCARVWTGYTHANSDDTSPHRLKLGMIINPSKHEAGAINFLGISIPAGHDGATARKIALDGLFNHSNVGPFVARHLIQRLVTSNPSPAYISRVASVFNRNPNGVRGDMQSVISAVLLDPEARMDQNVSITETFGKLRDPVVRLVHWAKAFGVKSPTNSWPFGYLATNVKGIGAGPGHAPSVFNWYRPGYTVRGRIADSGLVAPELQITTEPQIISYVNQMQHFIIRGAGEARPDYSALKPLASDSTALLAELNLVLAANQLSATTLGLMQQALDSISPATNAGIMSRIHCAITMVMASPDYLVLR